MLDPDLTEEVISLQKVKPLGVILKELQNCGVSFIFKAGCSLVPGEKR